MKFPKLKGPAVLAPMASVTDVAFRALCKRYGAALTYTQLISSASVVREVRAAERLLRTFPGEKPVAVQLFGGDFDEIVEATKRVENDFDIIDVNLGCPAWCVIRTGAGSELLRDPRAIYELVGKLVDAVNKPVTVKIRTGIDKNHINAIEVARLVEEAGAAAVTVHGRTQRQRYGGVADWDVIKRVREAVGIPVIGNGDVASPETFRSRLEASGVDYVMIGRAARSNPYIFRQVADYLKTGSYDVKSKSELFFEYLKLAKKYDVPFPAVRAHAIQFTKGLRGGRSLRIALGRSESLENVVELVSGLE